ncbi:MAG: leucine-rich repeat domain-containing protein [Rikenellaceae bacterium]
MKSSEKIFLSVGVTALIYVIYVVVVVLPSKLEASQISATLLDKISVADSEKTTTTKQRRQLKPVDDIEKVVASKSESKSVAEVKSKRIKIEGLAAAEYPMDADCWIITDAKLSQDAYNTLQVALVEAKKHGLKNELVFENLSTIDFVAPQRSTGMFGSSSLRSIKAPNVTYISESAFRGCGYLERIEMPQLKIVGKSAFRACRKLSAIVAPNMEEIGELAFDGCSALRSVDLSNAKEILNHAFSHTKIETIDAPKAERVEYGAFKQNNRLKSVNLPMASEVSSSTIFSGCTSLTKVNMPLYTKPNSYEFSNCTSITEVSLPKLERVSMGMFGRCESMAKAHLPSADKIGAKAFEKCANLRTLEIATEPGVKLVSVAADAFVEMDTKSVNLIIGAHNKELVSGKVLSVNGVSVTFGSVKLK